MLFPRQTSCISGAGAAWVQRTSHQRHGSVAWHGVLTDPELWPPNNTISHDSMEVEKHLYMLKPWSQVVLQGKNSGSFTVAVNTPSYWSWGGMAKEKTLSSAASNMFNVGSGMWQNEGWLQTWFLLVLFWNAKIRMNEWLLKEHQKHKDPEPTPQHVILLGERYPHAGLNSLGFLVSAEA